MKKSLIVMMLFCCGFTACPKNNPTPVTEDISYCKTAEEHLKELGCIPKDKPYTAKGKSFTEFCQQTQLNGIALHPKCLSEITACGQINACVQAK